MLVFISGGARSGKSTFAESYAEELNRGRKVYLATSIPYDDEMKERVRRHQENRSKDGWLTIEKPHSLREILPELLSGDTVLIDCLTIWLSNVMFRDENADCNFCQEIIEDVRELSERTLNTIIVSNDVFCGVSDYKDEGTMEYLRNLGKLHIEIAQLADEAYECIGGIPLKRK